MGKEGAPNSLWCYSFSSYLGDGSVGIYLIYIL